MANVYATKSGNWSDTTVWNTSTLPTTVDDVYANNFTVYVDDSFRVSTIQNLSAVGIARGGRFILNNAISLSANAISGGLVEATALIQFLSASPNSATFVGNMSANSPVLVTPRIVQNNSTGTLTIYGNVFGGRTNAAGGGNFYLGVNSGIMNVFGNVRGADVGRAAHMLYNTGTLTVFGNVSSGAAQFNRGLWNNTGTSTVSGNVIGGIGIEAPSITIEAGTCTIFGAVYSLQAGNQSNNSPTGIVQQGGTVNIVGDVLSNGLLITGSTSTANITGSVLPVSFEGIRSQGNSNTVNIVGNVRGSSSSSGFGVVMNPIGTVQITGNATGGSGSSAHGVLNNVAGYVNINGNVIGGTGSTAYGAFNNATGYMEVQGLAVGNGWGLGSSGIGGAAPGVLGSQTGTTIIRGLSCGARGQWPTAGNVFIVPQNTSTATLFTSASAAQVLFTSLSTNIVPPASSVRLGTVYNLNQSTGTCAMPSISSVLEGVAVDNSIGIAALQPQTIWNYSVLSATDVNSLGGRLKDVATVQSVGQQLTALN